MQSYSKRAIFLASQMGARCLAKQLVESAKCFLSNQVAVLVTPDVLFFVTLNIKHGVRSGALWPLLLLICIMSGQ